MELDLTSTSTDVGTAGQDEVTPFGIARYRLVRGRPGIPVGEIGLQFEWIKVTCTEIDGAGLIRAASSGAASGVRPLVRSKPWLAGR